ncbi:MAG: UDP-3-O-acyl-N-acetylglucosamine deacetylase [Planctomycetota bacterium]|nr:UDP-3-O-acyl-N-acetylglucosamine deacetylase [Planctomycetota bacterium]
MKVAATNRAVSVGLQRTLAGEAVVSGMGLFTGQASTARIRAARPDSGVVFVRSDLADRPRIPATVEHVVARPRRTTLQAGEATIEMVEHCLSALAGLGIDNAVVEVDGGEMPAGDGSALPYVEAILAQGLSEQESARRPIVVTEPIVIREGDASITALPSPTANLDVMYDLDYRGGGAALHRQVCAFTLDPEAYLEKIAPARTYAMADEARAMRERGMFAHLTPRDVLVIGEDGPIDNELRFPDEPARHKVLDLIGDLSLAGRPVQARIIANRSGHALNHRLAAELAKVARGGGDASAPAPPAMDIRRIMRLLPHRYPFVLVDRVLEIEGDRRAVGVKNVSINEPFFQGHYPGSPIMPGVLIVEAMSQLAGLMLSQKLERTGKVAILLSLDGVKLRKSVTPGDQLMLHSEAIRATSRFGECDCRAFVGDALVAEARVKFMMVDAEQD